MMTRFAVAMSLTAFATAVVFQQERRLAAFRRLRWL